MPSKCEMKWLFYSQILTVDPELDDQERHRGLNETAVIL